MIVDTSIVVALAAREPSSAWVHRTLNAMPSEPLRMSWVNIAEAGMVLDRASPGSARHLEAALAAIGIEALEAGREVVLQAIAARSAFPLNFGDCFAYAHARLRGEALITLDDDFLRTDLPKVLHPHAPAPSSAPAPP